MMSNIPEEENDIVIPPPTLTLTEISQALHMYITKHSLQDRNDTSIVNCDSTFRDIFNCDRMLYSAMISLLKKRNMIVKVISVLIEEEEDGEDEDVEFNGGNEMQRRRLIHDLRREQEKKLKDVGEEKGESEEPIVLTYIMTVDGATTLYRGGSSTTGVTMSSCANEVGDVNTVGNMAKEGVSQSGDVVTTTASTTKRSREENEEESALVADSINSKRIKTTTMNSSSSTPPTTETETALPPSLVSYDIDIHIPTVYHNRTREILRRIKRREFEYTSSRTKALKTLLSTITGSSSKCEEEEAKNRIEEVVTGNGLTTEYHGMTLLSLAKAAPASSEARMNCHVDVRTSLLLERIEEHVGRLGILKEIVRDCCRFGGSSSSERVG
mmetsp:Transcript_7862/g.11630  ORF Transcript_7862/g.11630 Transcript_7862/m.11630 type:complete len:384 (-) Transcript_7862:352-1503(-)